MKVFTIQVTTSASAKDKIPEHEIVKDPKVPDDAKPPQPKYIHVSFSDRTCFNKLWYLLYIGIRAFYVSVWYYFAPLLAVLLSYIVATYLAWT